MPLIDTRVPLIAVSCLAQSWSQLSTPATAETHRTIAIASHRSTFLKKRLVSTVFDEVEVRFFVADGHRTVSSWARR
jgi:hypothetical protein